MENFKTLGDGRASGANAPAGFPEEAFECPHCGQMLAPTCRVCVSCKSAIDPGLISRPHVEGLPAAAAEPPPQIPAVRFPWPVFFGVLAVSWFASTLVLSAAGLAAGQLMMSGAQLLSAVWVFFDARQKFIRKPLRWAVGVLILWIVIFPWYLVRRRKLEAPCPFVESDSGSFTRVILLVIFLVFVVGMFVSRYGGAAFKNLGSLDGAARGDSVSKK